MILLACLHLRPAAMAASATVLVAELHGEVLRILALAAQRHFQGLGQATRWHRDKLSSSLRRRLLRLEAAYQVMRHITEPLVTELLDEVGHGLVAHALVGAEISSTSPGEDCPETLCEEMLGVINSVLPEEPCRQVGPLGTPGGCACPLRGGAGWLPARRAVGDACPSRGGAGWSPMRPGQAPSTYLGEYLPETVRDHNAGIQICLKTLDCHLTLLDVPTSATIDVVKAHFLRRSGNDFGNAYFQGSPLLGDKTLSDYNIQNGDEIKGRCTSTLEDPGDVAVPSDAGTTLAMGRGKGFWRKRRISEESGLSVQKA